MDAILRVGITGDAELIHDTMNIKDGVPLSPGYIVTDDKNREQSTRTGLSRQRMNGS